MEDHLLLGGVQMVAGFLELIKHSPYLAIPIGMFWFAYKAWARLVASPVAIATLFSVIGGKERRRDAHRALKTLCDRKGPPLAIGNDPPGDDV